MAMPLQQLQVYPELLLSLLCFIFLFLYLQFSRSSPFPVNWPFLGMLPSVLLHLHCFHDWSTRILREAGCTFHFFGPWFMGHDSLCTADPANLQHIFNLNFPNYPKGVEFAEIFDILGDGIFTCDGDAWKKQRTRAHSLMSGPCFRAFVGRASRDKVENGLLPFVSRIAAQGAEVDLQNMFLRLTFDMTFYLVFGVDPLALSIGFPTVPFARAMDDAMSALFLRHVLPSAWWKSMRRFGFWKERKIAVAWNEIDRFIAESIADMKTQRGLNGGDLLSTYIKDDGLEQDVDDDDDDDDKFLRDTALNFMLAGRDTTGAALSWFFWLLAKNPAAESRIVEELNSVAREKDQWGSDGKVVFEAEEVCKLVYLHAALCEALRLFPPVPFEHKAAQEEDVLPSGHKVERGTRVLVSLYAMGRMEGIWGNDCLEFRPERWISEKGSVKHEPSYKFISFNSGPRTCLGKEVAFTQMKVVASTMLYNFRVELVEGQVVEPKLSIILHMRNGLKVRIKKRASENQQEN